MIRQIQKGTEVQGSKGALSRDEILPRLDNPGLPNRFLKVIKTLRSKRFAACKSFYAINEVVKFLVSERYIDVVSFDVFDTLVVRRCAPDAVLDGTANWIQSYLAERKLTIAKDPMEAYHQAYRVLVDVNVGRGLDCEVFTSDLYKRWAEEVTGSKEDWTLEVAAAIKNQMQEHELWTCVPNPTVLPLLKWLKEKGVRTIFTSDMYLGIECVSKILEENGLITYFNKGYVSGDLALLKRTGKLFHKVFELENVEPHRFMHIGDSLLADGEQAAASGAFALVHREPLVIDHVARLLDEHAMFRNDRRWGGHLVASFAQSTVDEKGTPEEAYGRRVLGPIYSSFIHRTLERCREEGIKKIYFLAREGFFLREIARKISPHVFSKTTEPSLHYLCVSRLSTLFGASSGFGLRELLLSLMNGPCTVKNLFSPLRLPDEELATVARRYGIYDIHSLLPHYYMSWPPFLNLTTDSELKAHWDKQHTEGKELLVQYLKHMGFFDVDRVAIVDVGWAGQIQESMDLTLRNVPNAPQIFGMYLATNLKAHWRKTERSWMEWSIADESHNDWQSRVAFQFPQGLEIPTRAPHGTVMGYESSPAGQGRTISRPLFKSENDPSRAAEASNDEMIALFQQGALQYADAYAKCSALYGLHAWDTLPYARDMVERMLRYPTKREASWFLGTRNFSDFGSSDSYMMGSPWLRGKPWKFASVQQRIANSFWKYGSLAGLGGWLQQARWALKEEAIHIRNQHDSACVGIVFHAPAPPKNSAKKLDSKASGSGLDEILEFSIARKMKDLVQTGRAYGVEVLIHERTAPLRWGEVVRAYSVYQLAKKWCEKNSKQPIYRGGIPFSLYLEFESKKRPWLRRAKNLLNKINR